MTSPHCHNVHISTIAYNKIALYIYIYVYNIEKPYNFILEMYK